jgi:hypothetical protein
MSSGKSELSAGAEVAEVAEMAEVAEVALRL